VKLSQVDDKALIQAHPEIAGSQLGSAVEFHDVTGEVATNGAIQIVHHVGRHPNSGPPFALADGTSLGGNPLTAEKQAGTATTTAHFKCGSHNLGPLTHLVVRTINGSPPFAVMSRAPEAAPPHFEFGSHSLCPPTHLADGDSNGSPPAAVESGAPEAAPPNAGSSLGALVILTISPVSRPAHADLATPTLTGLNLAAPASLHALGKPVATSASMAHHDDTLQRQHLELSHNKLILRKQWSEISSNNQVLKKQWLELSSHFDGNSPGKDKSKDKCNKCGKLGH